jgi:hypothetical protein
MNKKIFSIWLFLVIGIVLGILLVRKNISFMKQEIPKQIFLTYKSEFNELPQIVKDNIEKTKIINNGYEIRYYSDYEAIKFIEENFPEYLDDFNTLVPGAYKADLLRLLLLYKYGGIYNDIGNVYLEPISKFISSDDTLVVCKDQGIPNLPPFYLYNAFIASIHEHPMIKKAIDVVIENVRNRFYGNTPLEPTGPGAFGKAFNLHFGRKEDETINVGIFDENTKIINNHDGIRNIDGTQLIKPKFDNYYETIYPEGREKGYYDNLWHNKKIYLG